MKLLTSLLLALLIGLGIYVVRRRIVLALKVAGVAYLVIMPVRLLFSAGDLGDRLDTLVWPVLGILLAWVVMWQVSLAYERRKRAGQGAGPVSR